MDQGYVLLVEKEELWARMLMELLKSGKVKIHNTTSDGQISILRIVPETEDISTLSSR